MGKKKESNKEEGLKNVRSSADIPHWLQLQLPTMALPKEHSWPLCPKPRILARVTPRAEVTSVRYITKVQGGSNVALLDVTPHGSSLMQDWFPSIWPHLPSSGVKSSFSS